jgi:3,4-dihydroxy-2-butanone 4-phosphate synthase
MSSREERRAKNEAIFRAGNEAIVHNTRGSEPMLPLICECGTRDCLEQIDVTPSEYESVRSHRARFVLSVGHQDESETVVDEFDRYSVVEKTGVGRAVVE